MTGKILPMAFFAATMALDLAMAFVSEHQLPAGRTNAAARIVRPLSLSIMSDLPPVTTASIVSSSQQQVQLTQPGSSAIQDGIHKYMATSSGSTSSMTLSFETKAPPTQEEIAQKKLSFNLWFWGGGFVAPFLATIFYFGFRFWEK